MAHGWRTYIGEDVFKVLETDAVQNSAAQSLQLGICVLQLGICVLLLLLQGRKGNAELLKRERCVWHLIQLQTSDLRCTPEVLIDVTSNSRIATLCCIDFHCKQCKAKRNSNKFKH